MVGTARYASIKTHMGIDQTRRDDLFSLGYLIIYWLKGGLPWQGMKAKNKKEKNAKIKDLKIAIGFDTLCKDLPKEFEEYFNICYKLSFAETPNYHSLRKLFKPEIGLPLDWEVPKKET
jgi:serine/threonine protein kinase